MANRVLADLAVRISANTAEFTKELQKTNSQLTAFSKSVTSIAGTLGVAFGLQQIGSFTVEVVRLAGEADGVRTAFNKFSESESLLKRLQRATAGTVSELELMKRATQAANFGISLEALPKLLEFASVRAQQTGVSVDYLVDSIVTGIGRKSPLILDNLGISAVALKEKLGDVSVAAATVGEVADAVGKIATESLAQTGRITETASTQMAKLTAEVGNLKVAIGDSINDTGQFTNSLVTLTSTVELLTDFFKTDAIKVLGFYSNAITDLATLGLPRLYTEIKRLLDGNEELNESLEETKAAQEDIGRQKVDFQKTIFNIAELEKQINETQELRKTLTGFELIQANKRLESLKEEKKILEQLGIEQTKAAERYKSSIDSLKELQTISSSISLDADIRVLAPTGLLPFQEELAVYLETIKETSDDSASAVAESQQRTRDELQRTITSAMMLGDAFGDAFGSVISGQATFAQGLARFTDGVVQQYGRQAIAAAIAKAVQSSPTAFGVVAAASAATAAISALLRSAAGYRGGRGGASSFNRAGFSSPNSYSFAQDSSGIRLQVDPIVIRGQDLYVSLTNYEKNNRNTRNG